MEADTEGESIYQMVHRRRVGDTIEISVRLYHFIELAAGSARYKLSLNDLRRAVVFYEE
jgi:hypothetical protein